MFEPCPTCDGSGFYFQHIRPTDGPSEPCPDCEGGGRVVSESVIEEMAEQLWLEDRLTRPQDYDVLTWSDLDDAIREHYREMAKPAARVVLEHMEDA